MDWCCDLVVAIIGTYVGTGPKIPGFFLVVLHAVVSIASNHLATYLVYLGPSQEEL